MVLIDHWTGVVTHKTWCLCLNDSLRMYFNLVYLCRAITAPNDFNSRLMETQRRPFLKSPFHICSASQNECEYVWEDVILSPSLCRSASCLHVRMQHMNHC